MDCDEIEIEATKTIGSTDVDIALNLINKQQEIIKNQSYTNKKLRKKIKTIRKERNKLQKELDLKDKVIENLYSDIEYEYLGTNYLKSLEEYYEEVEKVGGEDE